MKPALSIRQPWAWLIVNGYKDIENRDWSTNFRGTVLIHAGKAIDHQADADLALGLHPVTGNSIDPAYPIPPTYETGGIVGVVEIVDCITSSSSEWFVGPYGFLIRNARPLTFAPLRGYLGFFNVPDTQVRPHGNN